MKKLIKISGLSFLGAYFLAVVIQWFVPNAEAQTITPGFTPNATGTMTAAQFVQAFTNATITNIPSGAIIDGAITTPKIANSAVTAGKVLTNTLTGGDSGNIAPVTITETNLVTGTLAGRSFGTTINWPTGSQNFTNVTFGLTNSQISSAAVLGTNSSSGTGSAGVVPKLDATGLLATNMMYIRAPRQAVMSANTAGATSWSTLTSITTGITNGWVLVNVTATWDRQSGAGGPQIASIQIIGASQPYTASQQSEAAADLRTASMSINFVDQITGGVAKTYTLQGVVGAASGQWMDSGTADGYGGHPLSNTCSIAILEIGN